MKISSRNGWRTTVAMPPLSALGVMLVRLSTKRCVATSVSLAVMSRETEMTLSPLSDHAVPRTQSLWEPMKSTCLAVSASMARTVLSPQPKEISVPSGDHVAP